MVWDSKSKAVDDPRGSFRSSGLVGRQGRGIDRAS
jgi:hypothetical protein